MALVAYSDSEASDSEPETTTVAQPKPQTQKPTPSTTTTNTSNTPFPSLVDRTNPGKIRVALDLKPESASTPEDADSAPRKKPKLGGGAFSGFNALLPAPKKSTTATGSGNEKKVPARKIFSLKTGATPGFDREADAEMRNEQAFGMLGKDAEDEDGDETIPKAGSLRGEGSGSGSGSKEEGEGEGEGGSQLKMKPEGEVKLKGNPMMFKPLSVGRASQQKKRKVAALLASSSSSSSSVNKNTAEKKDEQPQSAPAPTPAPKPKISLFSLSTEDTTPILPPTTTTTTTQSQNTSTAYEPLVYTPTTDALPAGPAPDPQSIPQPDPSSNNNTQTLNTIADDLNLSKAQRRQLFGRHADTSAASRVLHFNTDKEYAANQEMLHTTDLAAQQHNPVRAIAPGKHSLQQLVNAASSQRDALEESFAAGRRNKKEAGSKYGW
ncbi:hypothetical protein BO78DRAFT_365365 [Aspergillus sclerotiicarbonarius CBS 121057]|uniref:Mitotic checkpoint regulator, MAD2B-interacting-domain-containing protein n=1 Tax=Aspergillus sclerotiicarbonarius (strain CBS 121057 / IBT 28362) TaxID=1448318 RepID=A0A319EKV8_ASPSB|nr:hypothetical protein BO78DRAFT_365365 [Aspergillus sclerotiicarbonarius CBS 121057]